MPWALPHRRVIASSTRSDCWAEPPEHGDVRRARDGLGQGQGREQRGLAAEAARRFPHGHGRAVEIGITEGLRRRHVPGAAGHRRNAEAKRLFDKGEEVAVGPRRDASALAFRAGGLRATEDRSESLAAG